MVMTICDILQLIIIMKGSQEYTYWVYDIKYDALYNMTFASISTEKAHCQ